MKKLSLNKETIVSLDRKEFQQLKAGANDWGKCRATYRCDVDSGGCTDGCPIILQSKGNCTDGHCTQDCTTGMTANTEKEFTSGKY